MLNIFKKKPRLGETVTFKISGMHCASCSMNIDGELEDLDGVISASTSYATAKANVEYDPAKVSKQQLMAAIKKLDYQAKEI